MKNVSLILLPLFISTLLSGQSFFDKGKNRIDKLKNEKAINDFHKSNIGEILFTFDRIPFEANSAEIVESADYGQEIFVREYWSQTMADAYRESIGRNGGPDIAILYIVRINDTTTFEQIYYDHSGKNAADTWFTNWFVASKPSTSEKNGFLYNTIIDEAFASNKQALMTNNTVELESYIYNAATAQKGKLLAKGKITILLNDRNLIGKTKDSAYPSCLETPKMKDKNIEKQFIDEMNSQGWKENFTHAVINKDDFTIIRNQLTSIIEGRTLGADMASKNSNKCMSQRFTFFQAYDGSSYSGKWKMQGVGEQTTLSCACLQL